MFAVDARIVLCMHMEGGINGYMVSFPCMLAERELSSRRTDYDRIGLFRSGFDQMKDLWKNVSSKSRVLIRHVTYEQDVRCIACYHVST
jgi:hypothetical protein